MIPISLSPDQAKELQLEFQVRVKALPDEGGMPPQGPPGPQIPPTGEITFENLTVRSASSQVDLPKWTPPPKPQKGRRRGRCFPSPRGDKPWPWKNFPGETLPRSSEFPWEITL